MEVVNALTIAAFYAILRQINSNVKEYVVSKNRWEKGKNCFEYTLEKQAKNDEEIDNRIQALIKRFQSGQKQPQYAYIEVHPNRATNLSNQNIRILLQSLRNTKIPIQLPYFQKICGEPFFYRLTRNYRLTVNINECNVFPEALIKNITNYSLLNDESSSYYDKQYALNIAKKLAFFGMIKYNLDSKILQFEPNLLLSQISRNNVFTKLEEAFQAERRSIVFNIVVFCVVFGILFALRSDSLLRLLKATKRFINSLFNKDYLPEDSNIKTIGSKKLKCNCGKNMDLLPPCHHLTCCRQCYQLNKTCNICGAVSLQGQVIYI